MHNRAIFLGHFPKIDVGFATQLMKIANEGKLSRTWRELESFLFVVVFASEEKQSEDWKEKKSENGKPLRRQ